MRIAAPAILVSLYMCAGCTRQPPDDPRRPVVETYAAIVLATYEDTLTATRALDQAVDDLLAHPSEQTLQVARERWRAARVPYGYSEAFRFYAGPIDGAGGPEPQINGWPLDENHIDAVQLDTYNAAPGRNIIGNPQDFPAITPELVAAQNEAGGEKNIASGWHAIEFLLWGQDRNDPPDSAGQRPYTDFVAHGDPATDVAARRGQYLKAATTLLIRDLEGLVSAWTPAAKGAPPTYRSKLVGGDVYTGLKHMLTGMAALSEVEMAGERMNVPLLSGDQEEEQSCFSDTTADDLRVNSQGIEHVYYARYTRPSGEVVTGPSLADLVKKADPRVAEEMEARLTRTRETLTAIRNPYDREILPDNKDGRARVQAGVDALHAQALSFGRAANSMQIFLSDLEGLGD
ncbi:MAG TPA: imelysin family protein [Povalibacter sp.]|nr:imelysin family protein [Povalibacter sp.]